MSENHTQHKLWIEHGDMAKLEVFQKNKDGLIVLRQKNTTKIIKAGILTMEKNDSH